MPRVLFVSLFILLCFFSACRAPSPELFPSPGKITGLEGYASLKVSTEEAVSRGRFSFLFHFPELGRIEATDIFGKSLFIIYFIKESAYLVIPGEKLFWQGKGSRAMEMFFGFELPVFDLISLITGDQNGRLTNARSGEMEFEIQERFGKSPYARILVFSHPDFTGQIRILRIGFDPKRADDTFSLGFLHSYQRISWEEIQGVLSRED